MTLSRKIKSPASIIIESTAAQMAAAAYEAGRSRGMTSKYKTPKAYAVANLEKFIPIAVDNLLNMLDSPMIPKEQKDLIFQAIQERQFDPDVCKVLPNIDISKVIHTRKENPVIVNSTRKLDIENAPLPIGTLRKGN